MAGLLLRQHLEPVDALDVVYSWYTSGCPAGAHCPNAYDANYGATGWAGQQSFSYDPNSNVIYDGTAWVEFNDYYSYTSSELQQNTCHEIGHILGLDHNFYKTSCLYQAITTDSSRYPAG